MSSQAVPFRRGETSRGAAKSRPPSFLPSFLRCSVRVCVCLCGVVLLGCAAADASTRRNMEQNGTEPPPPLRRSLSSLSSFFLSSFLSIVLSLSSLFPLSSLFARLHPVPWLSLPVCSFCLLLRVRLEVGPISLPSFVFWNISMKHADVGGRKGK